MHINKASPMRCHDRGPASPASIVLSAVTNTSSIADVRSFADAIRVAASRVSIPVASRAQLAIWRGDIFVRKTAVAASKARRRGRSILASVLIFKDFCEYRNPSHAGGEGLFSQRGTRLVPCG